MHRESIGFLFCISAIILACLNILIAESAELTFELPDNEKMCFHEIIDSGVKCTLEYQVITGGNYDIDVELLTPDARALYKEVKRQYDSHTWTTNQKGEFKFCFSNEFSTFTHKLVYFDFKVGFDFDFDFDEEPIKSVLGDEFTALRQMETLSMIMHDNLKTVIDYQTHHWLRKAQGEEFAENLNTRVQLWSIGQSVVILLVGVGQILVLRSFFTDKRPNFMSMVST